MVVHFVAVVVAVDDDDGGISNLSRDNVCVYFSYPMGSVRTMIQPPSSSSFAVVDDDDDHSPRHLIDRINRSTKKVCLDACPILIATIIVL